MATQNPNPLGAKPLGPKPRASLPRRLFRRGPWENAATGIIALGVVMLCQPFALTLYTYSFVTILLGTVMFTVVTKFPD